MKTFCTLFFVLSLMIATPIEAKSINLLWINSDSTTNKNSFFVSPIDILFGDASLSYQRKFSKFALGISIGYIFKNNHFSDIANDNIMHPGTSYSGFVSKAFLKIYSIKGFFLESNNQARFVSFENVQFVDRNTKCSREDNFYDFTMSESSFIYRTVFVFGKEIRKRKKLFLEYYYGLGISFRFRNYEIKNMEYHSSGCYGIWLPPEGNFKSNDAFPYGTCGIRLGFKCK